MVIHQLKCLPIYFEQVLDGHKRFELRKFDRPFMTGEYVQLKEWKDEKYSGRSKQMKIIYILTDFVGLKKGYCILGLR